MGAEEGDMSMWLTQISGLASVASYPMMGTPDARIAAGQRAGVQAAKRIRGMNREQVISILVDHGPVSENAIIKLSGLSRNTVAEIMRDMFQRGQAERSKKGWGTPGLWSIVR
jgi:hypothetical protein